MNPADFAKFLSPRLGEQIVDTGRFPRWPVLRERICAGALTDERAADGGQ